MRKNFSAIRTPSFNPIFANFPEKILGPQPTPTGSHPILGDNIFVLNCIHNLTASGAWMEDYLSD